MTDHTASDPAPSETAVTALPPAEIQAETAQVPEAAPAVVETVADVPVAADPVPEEVAVEVPVAPQVEAVPEAVVPSRPVRRIPRKQISDETLNDWQAKLAAVRAAKERQHKAAQNEAATKQRRAEGFRILRDAVRALEHAATADTIDPELQALADDGLARQVHQAPEHVRQILAATLAMLPTQRKRGRKPKA